MRALITGITGQDGSYLTELLLAKGYEVYGLVRPRDSDFASAGTRQTHPTTLLPGDLLDQTSLNTAMQLVQPDEIYNLAAQSSVALSWKEPTLTADVNGLGVFRLLEATRLYAPRARFFQASSSEMFGGREEGFAHERSPFRPRSPYGIAKLCAHNIVDSYRGRYGMFACCGIFFNHESPRRRCDSVVPRLVRYIADTKLGTERQKLAISRLNTSRDCGFAGDYVSAMWLMLQQARPADYVIATGTSHTMHELLELAFGAAGLNWRDHIVTEDESRLSTHLNAVRGDWSKARKMLGWSPRLTFEQLIHMLVDSELKRSVLSSGTAQALRTL